MGVQRGSGGVFLLKRKKRVFRGGRGGPNPKNRVLGPKGPKTRKNPKKPEKTRKNPKKPENRGFGVRRGPPGGSKRWGRRGQRGGSKGSKGG